MSRPFTMRCLLILSSLLFITNCNDNYNNIFFSEYKDLGENIQKEKILSIDSAFLYKSKYPAYKFEFNSWHGMLVNEDHYVPLIPSLKGYLYERENKIYYIPTLDPDNANSCVIFNFDMKKGEKEQYSYTTTTELIYSLELENIFFDKKDSIFKFKFHNVNTFEDGLDVVCYVNKNKGILGMYMSYFNGETDEVYSQIGEIVDYSKLTRFKGGIK